MYRRLFLGAAAAAAGLGALPLRAGPVAYALEADRSTVGFTYQLAGTPTDGQMPVSDAELTIDFDRLSNTRVAVTLDVTRARAGFVLATEAIKGASILDARRHPTILFVSEDVQKAGDGARMIGKATIRGVTQPLTLDAQFYRQRETEAGDLSRLSIYLTGTLDRRDFGATGYPDLVSPEIELRILTRIRRVA